MRIEAVKTRILVPPQDDLLAAIRDALRAVPEKSVLAVTSKVVSIGEGRCVPKSEVADKDELIKQEADKYLSRDFAPGGWVMHTIKNNLFIPSAGIDESNAYGHYILWPRDVKKICHALRAWVQKEYGVREVGVVITDSHTIPLRRGTMGSSLAHAGFVAIKDYRGKDDLFGRKYVITTLDIADGLAAAAVLAMGEGSEQTPLALITEIPFVEFGSGEKSGKPFSSHEIEEKEDLYYPLLSSVPWEKGGGGSERRGMIDM